MVLELRDKLPETGAPAVPTGQLPTPIEEDVLSALLNLGYQRAAAEKAFQRAVTKNKAGIFDVLFREALAALTK